MPGCLPQERERGGCWGLKASQKGCLWRAALPLSLLLAKPFLHLILGMREMIGSQLQKIISLSPRYPEVPYFTCFRSVWFDGSQHRYRNRLQAPWKALTKEGPVKADRPVPGCVVVSERASSKGFPEGNQQDFSHFTWLWAASLTPSVRKHQCVFKVMSWVLSWEHLTSCLHFCQKQLIFFFFLTCAWKMMTATPKTLPPSPSWWNAPE